MNSITSTSSSTTSVRIVQRYRRYVGLSLLLILMLSCASQAEAVVVPIVDITTLLVVVPIVDITTLLKGDTPQVDAATLKAQFVVERVLPQLIGNDDIFAKRLGFTGWKDVDPGAHSVRLATPYPVFIVNLVQFQDLPLLPDAGIGLIAQETNWLIKLNPDSTIQDLAPGRYLYPIQVDGSVVSSVMLALDRNDLSQLQWNILQIGYSRLITQINKIQQRQPGKKYILVRVPALNRYYLAAINQEPAVGQSFNLTAIFNDPGMNMRSGETMSAKELFFRLGKESGKINLEDPNYPPQ